MSAAATRSTARADEEWTGLILREGRNQRSWSRHAEFRQRALAGGSSGRPPRPNAGMQAPGAAGRAGAASAQRNQAPEPRPHQTQPVLNDGSDPRVSMCSTKRCTAAVEGAQCTSGGGRRPRGGSCAPWGRGKVSFGSLARCQNNICCNKVHASGWKAAVRHPLCSSAPEQVLVSPLPVAKAGFTCMWQLQAGRYKPAARWPNLRMQCVCRLSECPL